MQKSFENFHINAREEQSAQKREKDRIMRIYDEMKVKFETTLKQKDDKLKELETSLLKQSQGCFFTFQLFHLLFR